MLDSLHQSGGVVEDGGKRPLLQFATLKKTTDYADFTDFWNRFAAEVIQADR